MRNSNIANSLPLLVLVVFSILFLAPLSIHAVDKTDETITIYPREYPRPLRNPLKGFTNRGRWEDNEWATLMHTYIKWNDIERDSLDDIPEIKAWCDNEWAGVEDKNMKVIPRLYLHWDGDQTYWPEDMETGDYTSEQFKRRVKYMIWKLGECWDGDPRVAHIEMGIIGKWGEHHSPSPTAEIQQILGEEFRKAFPHKKVLVRHANEFTKYKFGIYWDSWAHYNQMSSHGQSIYNLGDRWKNEIIGGEVAYNWGDWQIQPGDDPTDTMVDPEHRDFFIYTLRWLHCTQLRWVADYDQNNAEARAGAEEVQKVFGYRYVIDEVSYPRRIEPGKSFNVSFTGRNTGSAPFYYEWPVEISLLDGSNNVVWSAVFDSVDIRNWLPGDKWEKSTAQYSVPAESFTAQGTFTCETNLSPGQYTIALAVLDPSGRQPSLRFATKNYLKGGRHPIGHIGVGSDISSVDIDSTTFDDPYKDKTLKYLYDPDLVDVSKKSIEKPHEFSLEQNYPNPFNPNTTISYRMAKNGHVKLEVFDIRGRLQETLVDQNQTAGQHAVELQTNDWSSGAYLYRLSMNDLSVVRKMILLR